MQTISVEPIVNIAPAIVQNAGGSGKLLTVDTSVLKDKDNNGRHVGTGEDSHDFSNTAVQAAMNANSVISGGSYSYSIN